MQHIIHKILIPSSETFEGLALGSRIASIAWPSKTIQPWLMSLAYGCTYVAISSPFSSLSISYTTMNADE